MPVVTEPRRVVVETDVAVVNRRDTMLRISDELGRHLVELLRRVRREDARVEGTGEEGVVDAVEHIRDRLVLAKDRSVDGDAGITGREPLDLVARLLREVGEHVVGGGERIMREQHDGLRLVARSARATIRSTGSGTCGQRQGDSERQQPLHRTPPVGCTTSNVPVSSSTVADVATMTLLTPRDVPAGSSSRRSGYSSPLVTTPTAGPPIGSSVTRLPISPSMLTAPPPPCTTVNRASPTYASRSRSENADAPSSNTLASK